MSILSESQKTIAPLKISVETGVFSGMPPDEYIVLTPLGDSFELNADDHPGYDRQEVRVSLFSKGNYLKRKRNLSKRFSNRISRSLTGDISGTRTIQAFIITR